jgi:contact-dependent growth inhibition (CDI) system CdiI-like immunity protein
LYQCEHRFAVGEEHSVMFNLELLGAPEGAGERLFNWGRITLGHFQEDFQAPLYDWAPGDYEAQWVEAAERLVQGAPVVVFLTHMVHATAPYHIGWPAWREGEVVIVQERLFVASQLPGPFDPAAPEAHLGPRCERSVEGQPISQWRITVGDVAQFLDRRRHGPVEDEQPMPPTSQSRHDRGRRARR